MLNGYINEDLLQIIKNPKATIAAKTILSIFSFILSDFGKGIAAESVPHVFEKFYRSRSSSTTPGTGLGLTIAHKVVTLHKGTIDVSSTVGEGTTFSVTLPKAITK